MNPAEIVVREVQRKRGSQILPLLADAPPALTTYRQAMASKERTKIWAVGFRQDVFSVPEGEIAIQWPVSRPSATKRLRSVVPS
jgi:hypothetical protein